MGFMQQQGIWKGKFKRNKKGEKCRNCDIIRKKEAGYETRIIVAFGIAIAADGL